MSSSTHLKAVIGDTFGPARINLKDGTGAPFDLTGSVLSIRIKTAGETIEMTTDVASGLVITDAANGQVTLTLSAAQTAQLLEGANSTYRLRRSIAGEVRTLIYGTFDAKKGGP